MYERDVTDAAAKFPDALRDLLLRLGLRRRAVDDEVRRSRDIEIAATDSRSMLGSLSDFAFMAAHHLEVGSVDDPADLSVRLARTPTAPLGYRYPSDVAEELLGDV